MEPEGIQLAVISNAFAILVLSWMLECTCHIKKQNCSDCLHIVYNMLFYVVNVPLKFEPSTKWITPSLYPRRRGSVLDRNTDALNLLAHSLGDLLLAEGDEVITTEMEHHSNFVPWQIITKEKKAILKVVLMDDQGTLSLDKLQSLLSKKTKRPMWSRSTKAAIVVVFVIQYWAVLYLNVDVANFPILCNQENRTCRQNDMN